MVQLLGCTCTQPSGLPPASWDSQSFQLGCLFHCGLKRNPNGEWSTKYTFCQAKWQHLITFFFFVFFYFQKVTGLLWSPHESTKDFFMYPLHQSRACRVQRRQPVSLVVVQIIVITSEIYLPHTPPPNSYQLNVLPTSAENIFMNEFFCVLLNNPSRVSSFGQGLDSGETLLLKSDFSWSKFPQSTAFVCLFALTTCLL